MRLGLPDDTGRVADDGAAFLALAPRIPVRTTVRRYPLADANRALADLREGRMQGAAVLVP